MRRKRRVTGWSGWFLNTRSGRNEFLNDPLLREIRVRNLTRSLFGSRSLADIAEALVPAHETAPLRISNSSLARVLS